MEQQTIDTLVNKLVDKATNNTVITNSDRSLEVVAHHTETSTKDLKEIFKENSFLSKQNGELKTSNEFLIKENNSLKSGKTAIIRKELMDTSGKVALYTTYTEIPESQLKTEIKEEVEKAHNNENKNLKLKVAELENSLKIAENNYESSKELAELNFTKAMREEKSKMSENFDKLLKDYNDLEESYDKLKEDKVSEVELKVIDYIIALTARLDEIKLRKKTFFGNMKSKDRREYNKIMNLISDAKYDHYIDSGEMTAYDKHLLIRKMENILNIN